MTPPERIELSRGSLVIGDLHLDLEREEGIEPFLAWLGRVAGCPRIVILGDLFEYWFGMAQARCPGGRRVLGALAALGGAGTAVDVVPGNRDFLLGRRFERASGCRVRPGGLIAETPGDGPALLLHGDELCTRDRAYLRMRRVLRSAPVRFLGPRMPRAMGRWGARRLRRASTRAVEAKPDLDTALQPEACRAFARTHGVRTVVCGHAHVFRDEDLGPDGPRWLVVGAFGGPGDTFTVGPEGRLEVAGDAPGTAPPC